MIALGGIIFASDSLALYGVEQGKIADSSHATNTGGMVYQWQPQSAGLEYTLIAVQEGQSIKGYFTRAEYLALMALKDSPAPLILVHPLIPAGELVRLARGAIGLVALFGTIDHDDQTVFTGPIKLITV